MQWVGWLGTFEVVAGLVGLVTTAWWGPRNVGRIAGRWAVATPIALLAVGYIWTIAGMRAHGQARPYLLVGVPWVVGQHVRVERLRRRELDTMTEPERRLVAGTPSWSERLRHPIRSVDRELVFVRQEQALVRRELAAARARSKG